MAPAGTVTVGGTVATAVLLLESVTAAPPIGAPALRVTAPVEAAPLLTLAGLTLTADSVVAGVTVSAADVVTPPYVAEMVSDVAAGTELVDTAKTAVEVPAGTITAAGTVAIRGLLLESAIAAPPAGAAMLRVTVPVEGLRSGTLVG